MNEATQPVSKEVLLYSYFIIDVAAVEMKWFSISWLSFFPPKDKRITVSKWFYHVDDGWEKQITPVFESSGKIVLVPWNCIKL